MQFTLLETLLDTPRLLNLIMYSARCQSIEGPMCEVGVFRGGSLDVLAQYNPQKEFYGLDSFEGLPATTEHDFHNKGDFDGVDHTSLAGYFKIARKNVRIIKGFVPKTFRFFGKHQKFSFVHIDCDLYKSIKDCLDYFVPRMSEGGIIILDDYKFNSTPGCEVALEEFFSNPEINVAHHGELTYADGNFIGQYIIVK